MIFQFTFNVNDVITLKDCSITVFASKYNEAVDKIMIMGLPNVNNRKCLQLIDAIEFYESDETEDEVLN